jgi:hypothetical protein
MCTTDNQNPIFTEFGSIFKNATDSEIIGSLNLQVYCKDHIDNHSIFMGALVQEIDNRGWDYSALSQMHLGSSVKLINNKIVLNA